MVALSGETFTAALLVLTSTPDPPTVIELPLGAASTGAAAGGAAVGAGAVGWGAGSGAEEQATRAMTVSKVSR